VLATRDGGETWRRIDLDIANLKALLRQSHIPARPATANGAQLRNFA